MIYGYLTSKTRAFKEWEILGMFFALMMAYNSFNNIYVTDEIGSKRSFFKFFKPKNNQYHLLTKKLSDRLQKEDQQSQHNSQQSGGFQTMQHFKTFQGNKQCLFELDIILISKKQEFFFNTYFFKKLQVLITTMKYNQIISIEQKRGQMKQNKCNKYAHDLRMLQFNELAFNDEMTLNISKFEGIIRGQWYREDGKLQSICYGTAIAISKRVILTCAHSIYLQKRRRVCDSVKFIPNHKQGKLNNSKVYKSAEKQYIRFQELRPDQTFTKGAVPEDIALIYLSEDLDLDDFPMVGLNNEEQVRIGGDLLIAGYPSTDYYSQPRLEQIYFKRHTLKGKLLQIQNHNIYHDLFTQTGHSGSGIVGFSTITRKPTVLGVHTHKGKKRNSGVYLSNFLLKRLAKYQIEFGLFHSQYKINIKFPQAFKINAFSELCETQKKMLSARSDYYYSLYNKDMQVELDQQNSQMPDIFKAMSTPQQQQVEMSIIHQQSIMQKLQKMMEENRNMALQILQYNQLSHLMYELVKAQNTFFQTLKKLKDQNKQATVFTKPIKKDLFQLCIRIDKQLSQSRYELQKMDRFHIIVPKFANVQEHLYRTSSPNQIQLQSLQQNDYQYHRFEEEFIQITQQFFKNSETSSTKSTYEFQRI